MDINEAYKVMQRECGIGVGDKVEILRPNTPQELGSHAPSYSDAELAQRKRIGVVTKIQSGYIEVGVADYTYFVPFFVLGLVEKYKEPEKMIMVKGKEWSEETLDKAVQYYANNTD